MAGNGNPYAVLNPSRLRLLRDFHIRATSAAAMAVPALPRSGQDELLPLLQANLLREEAGCFQPTFLVVSANEVERVDLHARLVGRRLADRALEQWTTINAAYRSLELARRSSLHECAFLLVGDCILDVGLLDALARESTLMPAAPFRPSPDSPKAQYYLWMIEGEHDRLGRYGQRSSSLPWAGWSLITFGEYMLGDAPNGARDELEAAAFAVVADPAQTPEKLALSLAAPCISQTDASQWRRLVRECSKELVALYREHEQSLRDLYTSLSASAYLEHGFGEFICWYHHVAYAVAIDSLAEAGVLSIPPLRFGTMVCREATQAGGL